MTSPTLAPSTGSAETPAELLAKADAICAAATAGPWMLVTEPRITNDLGRQEFGTDELESTPQRIIATEWSHPQLKGPMAVVGLWSGPYADPQHFVGMSPRDGEFIAASRELVPQMAEALRAALIDAARYRALAKRMVALDFDYATAQNLHATVAIIELPNSRFALNANAIADRLVAVDAGEVG